MTGRADPGRGRRLDAQLRASIVSVAAAGAGLAFVTLALFGVSAAFSVAVGSAIATGNLWALARIVSALLPRDAGGGDGGDGGDGDAHNTGAWALVGVLKMLGLFVVVYLLMRHEIVSPIPMLAGFGALPIGIAIGSLVSHRGPAPEDRH
jgi:hypothetical protein